MKDGKEVSKGLVAWSERGEDVNSCNASNETPLVMYEPRSAQKPEKRQGESYCRTLAHQTGYRGGLCTV